MTILPIILRYFSAMEMFMEGPHSLRALLRHSIGSLSPGADYVKPKKNIIAALVACMDSSLMTLWRSSKILHARLSLQTYVFICYLADITNAFLDRQYEINLLNIIFALIKMSPFRVGSTPLPIPSTDKSTPCFQFRAIKAHRIDNRS